MILDTVVIVLTGLIAGLASWMAIGLLRQEPQRVEAMREVGFLSPAWPTIFGTVLLIAVVALVVGWWFKPLGIAGMVTIKALYLIVLIAYRRARQRREKDLATAAMTAHSIAALVLLAAW